MSDGARGVVISGLEVVVTGLLITTGSLGCFVVGFGVMVGVVKENIVGFGVVEGGGGGGADVRGGRVGYTGEVVRGGKGVKVLCVSILGPKVFPLSKGDVVVDWCVLVLLIHMILIWP